MKCEKPITEKQKEKVNKLYRVLKSGVTLTKTEIMTVCEVSNERSARELISILAQRKPILSTSDQKGYRLAITKDDLQAVIHQHKENDSRIDEIQKRNKPLIEFEEKFDYFSKNVVKNY